MAGGVQLGQLEFQFEKNQKKLSNSQTVIVDKNNRKIIFIKEIFLNLVSRLLSIINF